jgi:protein TonB
MRKLMVISAAVHLGLIVLLPIFPNLGPRQPLALEVYAVELVDIQREAPPAEEPIEEVEEVEEAPVAEPVVEDPIPEKPVPQPKRIVPVPPKRAEKSLEEKLAERLKEHDTSRPQEEPKEREAPKEVPSGTTKVTAGNVADYYLTMLQGKITRNWKQPSARFAGGDALTVRVSFRVMRSGEISNLRIARSSNWTTVDQSAIQAVRNSAPFAELPQSYPGGHLDVTIDFTVTQ